MPFDPNKFQTMVDTYIETADRDFNSECKRELNALRGLSSEQIEHFGGTTEQMEEIIKEGPDYNSYSYGKYKRSYTFHIRDSGGEIVTKLCCQTTW